MHQLASYIVLWTAIGAALVQSKPQLGYDDLFNLFGRADGAPKRPDTCGYESCPTTSADKLNVHIIAHTHDDVGWLKTTDQYYFGTKKNYSPMGVQYILDSVIPQLVMDKSKRFIYVEMSFFSKWWQEQDDTMRSIVRRLVNEGRLEFINGGWCMNDEATVTYHSTIEQMTLGLRFLNETFGSCGHPKVGWQIDPFGHSSEQASLFGQFGFDGMFFTRISYEDKRQRTENKSLDLIWHGDRALSGQSGSIFTNIFRDGYDAPNGFCFDAFCKDDIIVDNKKSYEYNIDDKGLEMIEFIRSYAKAKLTNHLLIPFGGDFQYSAAGQNFKSLDKLMRYIRIHAPDINIFYSTPSCYQYSVHQVINDKSIKLPEKFDDFMPYDSASTIWWSGYFTSRPSVKLIERETANLLKVARLISLSNLLRSQGKSWNDDVKLHESKCLLPLWEILGDLQHHDAVTGTEKQHVANDYVRRASDAFAMCAKFIGETRRSKFNENLKRSQKYDQLRESGKKYKLDPVYLEGTMFCPLLNISQCDAMESDVDVRRYMMTQQSNSTKPLQEVKSERPSNPKVTVPSELETKSVLVSAYNPIAHPVTRMDIRLPCNGRCDLEKVQVIHLATNETMKVIRLSVPAGISTLPFRDATTNYEILFYANIPALGSTSFVVGDANTDDVVDEEVHPSDSFLITDETTINKNNVRSRRIRSDGGYYEYFNIGANEDKISTRHVRDSSTLSQQGSADRVIVKFDMSAGVIVGLKRANDGSILNITQKFGYYFPSNIGWQPGAYIFRPNTSSPYLIDRPASFKMYKRENGALIEIHQKWTDWIWQTIRVDAKKNYIEFDYVVGPIPIGPGRSVGREVVTRYITNMANDGVFFTDSNGRQLLTRHKLRSETPEQLGGSFFPVVSTAVIKNNHLERSNKSAETFAVLVDRPQAVTSLDEGQLEFLIHRRHLVDDNFGVGEALNEPGEDGRGLVTRGRHRLYLKFQDNLDSGARDKPKKTRPKLYKLPETPRSNLAYEQDYSTNNPLNKINRKVTSTQTYIVHDQTFNDLRQESTKNALKPILTFDRLRVSATELVDMLLTDGNVKIKTDLSLLNNSLPNNVHLLTLQPWYGRPNQILIRLENLDNPLTLHPFPDYEAYLNTLRSYSSSGDTYNLDPDDTCMRDMRPKVTVDVEYLIKRIRITSLEELNLGANIKLKDDKRLNWTDEEYDMNICDPSYKPTSIRLSPRQIRTFLATFEFI